MDDIAVVWGSGDAGTELGAFDAALAAAGVHNYNLVTYSSVVPPGTAVVERDTLDAGHQVGTPVGVVLAEHASTTPGETVAAGLGWVTAPEGGVFMESAAATEAACRADLERKLADARERRDWDWRDDGAIRVASHTVETAGAAVVAAVYGPLAYADASE